MTGSVFVDGIGGGSVAASAMFQVDSTTKGFLIPRMTTAEKNAIAAPATSLLVYDLTVGAYYTYIGGWVTLAAGGGGAPSSATYITQTPNSGLSAEQALSLLSTGFMFVTTTTGVVSSVGSTGSGNVVLATSPTIATPTIAKLANLTTNGRVRTTGGDGTLGVVNTATLSLAASGGFPSAVSGCALAKFTSASNAVNTYRMGFTDAVTQYAEWAFILPLNYDGGTITFAPIGMSDANTGDVVLDVQARAYADSDVFDTAYGTAVALTLTIGTAGDVENGGTSSAITIAGTPATGNWCQVRCYRDGGAGGDTLASTFYLLGLNVTIGVTS